VRQASDEIAQRASEAETTTRSVVADAVEAERVVAAVAESLKQVDGITSLIAGVATQTNLLALNASIEATRAGVAGSGFAVVAGEVKGLAANTKNSTVEITRTVAKLRADAAAMSASITAMAGGVDGINTATTKVTSVSSQQKISVLRLGERVNEAVELLIGDRTVAARLHDLSVSGLMCVVDAAAALSEGQALEVTINVGGQRHTLPSIIRRRFVGDDGVRLGLEFTSVPPGVTKLISDFLGTLLEADPAAGQED
jgi:methyl-accepting chemotaxis protein